MVKDKRVQSLRLQKPKITKDDWVVINEEETQVNIEPFLFRKSQEYLEALEKADYKVRFGVRNV